MNQALITVFGRRMSDGKGLVVRPPDACQGQTTANGKVQPDLLPVVVVYENAETLDFGIAYLSEDAYESPLSVLKFGGATIEKATRPSLMRFRRAQKNLITRAYLLDRGAGADVLKQMGYRPEVPSVGRHVRSYERFRLSGRVEVSWCGDIGRKGVPTIGLTDAYDAESNAQRCAETHRTSRVIAISRPRRS